MIGAVRRNENALNIPEDSALVLAIGSGGNSVKEYNRRWCDALGRTSRSVFGSFCESLAAKTDAKSGGAPQLVGLYRKGLARYFGVIYEGQKYLLGVSVESDSACENVEWRNSLFERCDCRGLAHLYVFCKGGDDESGWRSVAGRENTEVVSTLFSPVYNHLTEVLWRTEGPKHSHSIPGGREHFAVALHRPRAGLTAFSTRRKIKDHSFQRSAVDTQPLGLSFAPCNRRNNAHWLSAEC